MFLQNRFLRNHATGTLADLVSGIIHDPAMLRYLHNDRNRRQAPNENLARELMELFTLGEGNGYTERDIREGARALTGYTFDDDAFLFRRNWHDSGEKVLFGQRGTFNGDDFVRLILGQRAVSRFICLKLYRHFVNDSPGPPSRDAARFLALLARRFHDRQHDLNDVLKTLLKSAHFYDDAHAGSLIKSPVQLVVQAIRSLQTPPRNLDALRAALGLMGQDLFFPPSVKGWEGGRAWINTSTLFVRQNIVVYLLTGRRPQGYAWRVDRSTYDAMRLVEHLRDARGRIDPEQAVTDLLRFTLATAPHPERVGTLVDYVSGHGGRIDNRMLIALLSLIAAMPEFQVC